MKIKSLIVTTCMALGSASPSFASYYDVDFSFKHVTGVFTFLSIADGVQPLAGLSVNGYGGDDWAYYNGTFTFDSGQVTSASFSGEEDYGVESYGLWGDTNTATLLLWALLPPWYSQFEQVETVTGAIHFGSNVPPALVPLPASLPLLLIGLAGFAGIRQKRKLAEQV